jgi:hypothetical protein
MHFEGLGFAVANGRGPLNLSPTAQACLDSINTTAK